MQLSLIDLHCDTAYELYQQKKHIGDPTLAVDFDIDSYVHYLPAMAIWSDKHLSDEAAYQQFYLILNYLKQEIEQNTYLHCFKNGILLGVEDARILGGKIERVEELYHAGVRLLTLTWSDTSCIGGAYNTNAGLTEFGKETVAKCFSIGIIPDVSHASSASFWEVAEIASGKPFIASHSNARTVCDHPRNLSDEQFSAIRDCGGLVGINLYTEHLGYQKNDSSGTLTVMRHIDHFLSLGGEKVLCFGCDFDGAQTPPGLTHPSDLLKLAEEMKKSGYSEALIKNIFWRNAKDFLSNHVKAITDFERKNK